MKGRTLFLALVALFCTAKPLAAADAGASPPPGTALGYLMHRPSAYKVKVIYHYKGHTYYRYAYPGYANGFPPPAFLYYGYPQSGYSYGVGF
jgi:hypothetical protein